MESEDKKRAPMNADISVNPEDVDSQVWQLFKQKRENERRQIERDESARAR